MADNNCTPIIKRTVVKLTDPEYFCNKSWTLSFNVNTKSWTSFHSYIPNWYIAENNFFYSGQNGCCDDLTALAINQLPPTTNTTTTNTLRPGSTTSTTTIFVDCDMAGDVFITEPTTTTSTSSTSTTTQCFRPTGLLSSSFIYRYSINYGPFINSSGSVGDACSAISVLTSPVEEDYYQVSWYEGYAASFTIGQTVYFGEGTSCALMPDGYYFTGESLNTNNVYHVVGGVITEIINCSSLISFTEENFNGITYRNGDPVTYCSNSIEWDLACSANEGAYCYLNFDPSYAGTPYVFFNWYAVNDSRNLAPVGYMIPSISDWDTYIRQYCPSFVNNTQDECINKFIEVGTTHWDAPNAGATNTSGFTAWGLGGYSKFDSAFILNGQYAIYWTSDEYSGNGLTAEITNIPSLLPIFSLSGFADKCNGFNVRFMVEPTTTTTTTTVIS